MIAHTRSIRTPFGDTATRVLLEVVGQERPSVPSIARALDLAKSTVHWHLSNLRALRLVDWNDRAAGTLHPLVFAAPHGSSEAAR